MDGEACPASANKDLYYFSVQRAGFPCQLRSKNEGGTYSVDGCFEATSTTSLEEAVGDVVDGPSPAVLGETEETEGAVAIF